MRPVPQESGPPSPRRSSRRGGLLLGLPPWATPALTALVLVGVGLLGRERPARLVLEALGFVAYAGLATLGLALGPQVA